MASYLEEGRSLHAGHYRPDIDGIRAIAVTSVVLCHAFPSFLPGGFIGVDVFFVISGYLISGIIIRDISRGRFSIITFYDRRIKRIAPALLTVMVFMLTFGWICLFRTEFENLGRHIVASTLFSENFLLWGEVGYFDIASTLKPTLHLWSLAIEEQFYIAWPLSLLLLARLRWSALLAISCTAAFSFALNIRDVHLDVAAAYYSPLGRSWEIMVGCGLAYLEANRLSALGTHSNILSVTGALLIAAAIFFIRPDIGFPGWWALLPTTGTCLLLLGGGGSWISRHLLSAPPMVWCGLISYPLYLWHWPFLSFGYIIFEGLSIAKASACVMAAVTAAYLTYVLVERPIRREPKRPYTSTLLAGGMGVVLASGALMSAHLVLPRLDQFDAPSGQEWDILAKLRPDLKDPNTFIYPLYPERPNQVLFIGDSHLAQYAGRVDKLISEDLKKPGAVFAVVAGCMPIEGWGRRQKEGCGPMKEEAFSMAESDRFQRIVIGAAWFIYFSEGGQYYKDNGKDISLTSSEGKQLALSQLKRRINRYINAGKEVILVLDNPVSTSFNPTGPDLRLSLSTKNFKPDGVTKLGPELLALHHELYLWARGTGATIVDPLDAVCSNEMCRVTTSTGKPLFRNRDHFNPEWALEYATFIDTTIEQ